MSIMRIKKEDNYVVLDKTLLNNKTLSWKAKGLHSYLMGLPDDWKVRETDLVNRSSDGRASTRSAIKELTEAGYIKRVPVREKGKFKEWEFVVHERPVFASKPEEPDTEKGREEPSESEREPIPPECENRKVVPPESDFPKVEKPIVENRTLLSIEGTKDPLVLKEVVVDAGAENALTKLINFYRANIEPLAPPFTIEKIEDDVNSYGTELVQFAIETATLSNVRKYTYITGILKTWAQAGVQTVEQARQQANQFRERQRTRGGNRRHGSSGMKEPEWLAKEKEKQQAHEAKQKEAFTSDVPDDEEVAALLRSLETPERS